MKVLSTDKAPAAIGPYSQALVSGGTVFVSGQIPVDPSTGMIAETIAEQTAQSLSNIENILAENGMTMENVIKTSVFLSDLSDFAAMNEVYASRFKAPYPARSCDSERLQGGNRMHRSEINQKTGLSAGFLIAEKMIFQRGTR